MSIMKKNRYRKPSGQRKKRHGGEHGAMGERLLGMLTAIASASGMSSYSDRRRSQLVSKFTDPKSVKGFRDSVRRALRGMSYQSGRRRRRDQRPYGKRRRK